MQENKNILITSVSSKAPLINCLKESITSNFENVLIYGIDSNENCIGKYFVDKFFKVDKINSIDIYDLLNKCKSWGIKLIIPSRDEDVLFYSKYKALFEKSGIHIMCPSYESSYKCIDKLSFFKQTKTHFSIPTSDLIEDVISESYVVKERFGAGSKKIALGLSKNDAISFAEKIKNPIFQKYITGNEISIDAYVDLGGSIKGVILRTRDLIIDGESKISTTFFDEYIENSARNIIHELNLYGHIMLQMLIDENGQLFVIECNPRFGGASTLSVNAGLDSFKWAYLESLNISIQNIPFNKRNAEIRQVRYSKDFYI